MADGAFGLVFLTDAVRTFHAEQVVATWDQGCDHFALKANRAIPAALPPCTRRGRGGAGRRARGRGIRGDPRQGGPRERANATGKPVAGITREAEASTSRITAHSACQRMLYNPGDVVQGRGEPRLGGAPHAVHPSLVRNDPVGVSGSTGWIDGSGGGGGGRSGHVAFVLGPDQG